MTQTYECPVCGEDVSVHPVVDKITCSHCQTWLAVNPDADYVNGIWRDCTTLTVIPKEFAKV